MAAHLDAVHSAPGDGRGVGGRRSVVGVVAPCARRRAERLCRGQFLLGLGLGADPAVRRTFSFFYHFANGIRHLWWDTGYGLDLPSVYRSGWMVIAFSAVATLLAWVLGYVVRGA